MKTIDKSISISPDGRSYPIPTVEEMAASFEVIRKKASGKHVVVVQGLGFVGAAVAVAVASAKNQAGTHCHFVIGVDLATSEAWWKAASLAEGKSPFAKSDHRFENLLHEVIAAGNLVTTASTEAYSLANVIIVDVQLDVTSCLSGSQEEIQVGLDAYTNAIRAVGSHMREEALVLVETTVPLGACSHFIRPILEEERRARGILAPLLLAHAYERVMPGRHYMDSITNFWRVFAADDDASVTATRHFLESITETSHYPLSQLGSTVASEMAKLLENSYRASNIAFIHEWTILAEKSGVNLWEVVDAIRLRCGTHDNMRYPGFGVGGYCLTKDSYLAEWGASHFLNIEAPLNSTLASLATNFAMPLHTLHVVQECLGGSLSEKRLLLCGVSYLADVADTRHSPALQFVDAARAAGANVSYHDPLVSVWRERPDVPSKACLESALADMDAVVFAVSHDAYRDLENIFFPSGLFVVDATNIVCDDLAKKLRKSGCRVAGIGKGHWRASGYHLEK